MSKYAVLAAGLALALTGCAVMRTREAPNANLASIKHPFVVHLPTDGRGVDAAIVRELRARGYDATYGAAPEMPANADARVIYQDRWSSDFTTYLISIQIEVRTARTDYPLALGYAERPSLFGQDKTVLIDKVLFKLFPAKKPLPQMPPNSDMPDFGNNVAPGP